MIILGSPLASFFSSDQNTGQCGWQGKLQDLDYYQELKASKHPAKMLSIAEKWLRVEVEEKRRLHMLERPQGPLAYNEGDLLNHNQGGFTSGRMVTDEEIKVKQERHGRLSDMMGNAGVIDKVRRVGGD
jgi:CCR4-NOT complex subunit CAF16